MFTPLQRRLQRAAVRIDGRDIRNYCNELFSNRLERHNVEITITNEFLDTALNCYPSTLYPSVINVVDNALHWLNSIPNGRSIEFHADREAIYISNNGPAIEEVDIARIFERGFSRKPSGRGLGLFISAKALEAEGMALRLVDPRQGFTVTFAIVFGDFGGTTN